MNERFERNGLWRKKSITTCERGRSSGFGPGDVEAFWRDGLIEAARTMSRKAANEKFNWKDVNRLLRERGVTLISAGLDEVPMALQEHP
jgi:hypothetical protein